MTVECECSLRTRLVGDGCSTCNPDYLAQFVEDDEPRYTITEAGRAMLRDAQQSSPDRQQGE